MPVALDAPRETERATPGRIYADGAYFCFSLEHDIREVPFKPVEFWKVPKFTAIPSGIYLLGFVNSDHFGPDTIAVQGVPGFDLVRMHGGTDVDDSEGCILVGDQLDATHHIHGAKLHHVLEALKAKIRPALERKERVTLQIRNAPEWYALNALNVPKVLVA